MGINIKGNKMLDKIKLWLKPSFKLHIYMKSGNVIVLDSVTEYKMEFKGNSVDSISITQKFKGSFLLVKSIDLSQIEAVCRNY